MPHNQVRRLAGYGRGPALGDLRFFANTLPPTIPKDRRVEISTDPLSNEWALKIEWSDPK